MINASSRILREPFRVFFALGLLAGLSGVAIWHLYHVGTLTQYSGVMHARFQIQGFLGAFVVGFLMTAIPRLLGVKPCAWWELAAFLLLFGTNLTCQWMKNPLLGDLAFFAIILLLVVFAARRFPARESLPPPFFMLLPMGILHALVGLGLIIWSEARPGSLLVLSTGQALLNQGFILCLILGIGSFLGPRFLGFVDGMLGIDSRAPPPGWWRSALLFLAVGALIFASFLIEALWPRPGQVMRALAASTVILGQMRVYRSPRMPGFLPQVLRWALVLIMTGLWAQPFFPDHRVAVLHILFIGGFSLITLVVATRVVFGHSGFEHLFKTRMIFVGLLGVFFTAALVFRVMSDSQPEKFFFFLNAASLLWMTGGLIWAVVILPKLFFPRPEEEEEEGS